MAAIFDRTDILRTWEIFRQPGEVTEVRILNAGGFLGTVSGYFDNAEDFTKTVSDMAADTNHPVPAIYFIPNPVNRDLLARAANKVKPKAKNTTSDTDIAALRWLLIDVDAKRPAGISSTDAEHDAAISKATEIRRCLIEDQGWPAGALVLGDSGNGAHLNVKIDLHNLPENVALIRGCLEALNLFFSDERIHVDVTSQNPARIWKLYGTMARKGDSTADRPHRLSRLLEVPDILETVTKEQLEALKAMLPRQEAAPKNQAGGKGFDPVAYCQAHNLQVHHTKPYMGGTLAVLEECIFDPSHKLSACIIGWPNGTRRYRCRHNSCLDKHWRDAKTILEPNAAKGNEPKDTTTEEEISEEDLKTIAVEVSAPITVNLEPDNFINQYIIYGEYCCDAYPEYHLGMALALLSIAANRNLIVHLKQLKIFTNMWIFILGSSTIARKSVAIGLAEELLKQLLKPYRLSESHSPEGFIEELSDMPKAYYIKDEVSSLLAAMEKPYMGEMRELLCNLYECKGESRKLRTSQRNKKSSFDINDPYITEVCATTGESFKELTTKLDITSGWLVRFLYFYPTYRKVSRPFELANNESNLLFDSVLARYKGIVDKLFNLTRPVTVQFEPEAFEYYQDWQMRRERELQANPDQDNIKNAVWGRLQAYAMKLATLFTVGRADYTTETKVSMMHVVEACRVVDEHFLPASLRVAEMVAMEETKNLQNRIISILRQHGGKIARTSLLKILHLKLSDINDAFDALIESEEITLVMVGNKGHKSSPWILLNQLDIKEKSGEEKKRNANTDRPNSSNSTNNSNNPHNRLDSSIVDTCIHETIGILGRIDTMGMDGVAGAKAKESTPTMGPHPRRDEPTPSKVVAVRFKVDYKSDWHGAMRIFKEGEIIEVSAERAAPWIQRGIVELVT